MKSITLILSFIVFALQVSGSALPDYPFVYVTGYSTSEVPPDIADLHFEIESREKDPELAYSVQSSVAKAVIEFSKLKGIDENEIVARPIQKHILSNHDPRMPQNRELSDPVYELKRSVTIQVKNLAVYPEIVDFLYTRKNVVGIRSDFKRGDSAAIEDALIREACAKALKNAALLAGGFSKTVKTVKAISESGFEGLAAPFGLPAGFGMNSPYVRSIGERIDFRVVPLTITFKRQVYAICEIQ